MTAVRAEDLSIDERIDLCWQQGELSWLLHEHQRKAYKQYRAWETLDPETQPGQFARIFGLECGKRYGKTTLRFLVRVEDCIRNPGKNYRYTSAFQKNIEEIVGDVAHYVLETCPDRLRPTYKLGSQGRAAGFYFPNGSVLRLVGLDKNPDGLRGRASDGDDISEAAFVDHLMYAVKNVLYHQYQGRPWARMCMESSAPLDPDHDFDMEFLPDCKLRGAYFSATIEDNPRLSRGEKDEFIRAAGGRGDIDCEREYFNVRSRDPKRYVVPEFNVDKHVRELRKPNYAHAYVAGDPGSADLFGLLWGYWHYEKAQLVIQRDWAETNAGTYRVADIIRQNEFELWATEHREPSHLRHERKRDDPTHRIAKATPTVGGKVWRVPFPGFGYWDGEQFRPNPYRRVCDVDPRLISDLRQDHEIDFIQTSKDNLEAMCNALRSAFARDQIVIDPSCTQLIQHLQMARWDDKKTKWERHAKYGHYDLVAALVYLWRNVDRATDPNPPKHWDRADIVMGHHPGQLEQQLSRSAAAQIANAMGTNDPWSR